MCIGIIEPLIGNNKAYYPLSNWIYFLELE